MVDTSAVIAYRRNSQEALNYFEKAERLYLPTVALGELYYGAYFSPDVERSLSELEELLPIFTLIQPNHGVAKAYGQIKARLRQAGIPISENDLWIAAGAHYFTVPLLVRDEHFDCVTEIACLQV